MFDSDSEGELYLNVNICQWTPIKFDSEEEANEFIFYLDKNLFEVSEIASGNFIYKLATDRKPYIIFVKQREDTNG